MKIRIGLLAVVWTFSAWGIAWFLHQDHVSGWDTLIAVLNLWQGRWSSEILAPILFSKKTEEEEL